MTDRIRDTEEILRERALRLATRPAESRVRGGTDVLTFRLVNEEYAVELTLLRGVRLARGLTPVPCTPAYVAGILNVRGEIVTVLDLAVAVGLAGADPPDDASPVILADHPAGRVGLLVTAVHDVRRIDLADLERAPSGREFIRGVVEGRRIMIDLRRLLDEGAFDVEEEAG